MPVLAPRHAISLAYAGLFFGIGIYLPFFPVWLEGRGFDAAMIAYALAVPFGVRLFTMPLGGLAADRSGRPRATLIVYALMTALAFCAVALAPSAALMLVALAVAASFWQPSLPVLDAYTVARRAEGLVDYGRVRVWGSLSFIVGNFAGGFLLGGLPGDAVVWFIVAGSLMAALAALALDEVEPAPRTAAARGWPKVSAVLAVAIIAAALVQSSHATLYAFASLSWRAQGLSDAMIGTMWATGVIAEVVLFRYATRVTRAFGPALLLAIGGLGGVIRFGAMSLDAPLVLLPVLQVLHAATFGCTYLGTVEMVARHAPAGRGTAVQALAAWATTIAMALATLASGPLWQAYGAHAFLFSAALAGAGGIIALLAARR
ncbi:PPP family 3-phenylpropionic acid transporter [Angulomicrobium tetraedrale]|uniref:PPP family 3-phenylpropionic acid transporter n=1 Tax=Ancylobacter tetraedralis TaxID=217068 RepID=A0A839ZDQ0_9HYPH|nr:PPP family 3-phenylpropionic acid transporter [Ancylobacter tetraedralis]